MSDAANESWSTSERVPDNKSPTDDKIQEAAMVGEKEEVDDLVFDGVFDNLEIDDIYSDLKTDSLNDMNYADLREKLDHSLLEVKELRKENGSLKRENEILKKNISSLYLTAKREIQRKDKEIKALNNRLMINKINANKRKFADPQISNGSKNEPEQCRFEKQEMKKLERREDELHQSRKRKRNEKWEKSQKHHKGKIR